MPKFTSGQWIVQKIGSKKWQRFFRVNATVICESCKTKSSYLVCDCHESATGLEQAQANARLIAAAPTMLAVLKRLVSNPDLDAHSTLEIVSVIDQAKVLELIEWWKLKNTYKRSLTTDDAKALRMIIKEFNKNS